MPSCFYIDISKEQWVKDYSDDPRLVQLDKLESSYFQKNRLFSITIFTDFLPAISDIPEWIWKLVGHGVRSILVLLDSPKHLEKCWELMNHGLSDIIIWEGLESLMRLLDGKERRWKKVNDILESPMVQENLIGKSRTWKSFLAEVVESSIFSSANIIIHGESGTGKELLSRLVHSLDDRPGKGKLILVDCTTIVPELSGSEFFGHEKGSYTSSINARDGAFALADNGTLFLDEVSELPLTLQAELLRVIQDKMYKRVGSNIWKTTNFRLICATNKNLESLVTEGKFRQDLYYRISDIVLKVPSLRYHSGDIEPLAKFFLKQFCKERQMTAIPEFDPAVMDYMRSREYHGNIRELRQVVLRMAMLHGEGAYITMGSIPSQDRPVITATDDFSRTMESWEESIKRAILSGESLMEIKNIAAYLAVKIAIDLERGDKQRAAERLNVTLRAVQQYTKKHQISA